MLIPISLICQSDSEVYLTGMVPLGAISHSIKYLLTVMLIPISLICQSDSEVYLTGMVPLGAISHSIKYVDFFHA
jgi:hypothetical protein